MAFQGLKEYLVRAPMLSALEPGEDLFTYLSVSACRECHAVEGSRCATTNILRQKNFGQCRDEVFASGEVSVSAKTWYKEVALLFSSSYRLCINRVSFAVIVEEI